MLALATAALLSANMQAGAQSRISPSDNAKQVKTPKDSTKTSFMEKKVVDIDEVVVVARSNINAIDLRAKAGVVENVDMKRVESKPMIDMALALQV